MDSLLAVVLASAATAGGAARVDYSALDPSASGYPVSRSGRALCGHGGAPDGAVLAAAIITYGRRPGRSTWGHTSLRFLACEEGLLRDVEYEYYRMGADVEAWFQAAYSTEEWTHDRAYLRRQWGRLVVLRNERPVDGGAFAIELQKNREVIEAWMPWPAHLRHQLYTMLDARYVDQLERLSGRESLTSPHYEIMGLNCTLHVREALAAEAGTSDGLAGSVFPMRNLSALQARQDVRFVLHPSPHFLQGALENGALPEVVEAIPRPLFRGRETRAEQAAVEAAVLPNAMPVVVEWLLDGTLATSP